MKLPEKDIQTIIQLYSEGHSPKSIGERFNIYSNSVTRILRKRGIERNQLIRTDPETQTKIVAEYQAGFSSIQVAQHFGIDDTTVCRILRRHGFEPRPRVSRQQETATNAPLKQINHSLDKESGIAYYATTYCPEWKGQHLTKAYVATLSEEEKGLVIPDLVLFYRERGFPYPTLTNTQLLQEFTALKNADISKVQDGPILNIYSQAGATLYRHFSPHFFEVKSGSKKNWPSLLEAFNDDKLLAKTIRNRLDRGYQISGNMLRQGLAASKIAFKPSVFNPMVAKFLYTEYTKPNNIIYDYSMGFGQRLVAALSLPYYVRYLGVDVLDKTVRSNQDLYDFFYRNVPMLNKAAEIELIGSEHYCHKDYLGKVNLAFSSPPYFNLEHYSNDPEQAYANEDYAYFINDWWDKTISNIDRMLAVDGTFIINVADKVNGLNLCEDMANVVHKHGFQLVKEYRLQLLKNSKFGRKEATDKYEPILIFQRK